MHTNNHLVLEVSGLSKTFPPASRTSNPFVAVDSVSFGLQKGEVVGLLGPNGAGKSTTISMLLGVTTPSNGQIKYFGKDLATNRSSVLNQVTFASTYIKMPWRLTVWENLHVYATLYGLDYPTFKKRALHFMEFFGVLDQKNKTMNDLSAGQITRVMLAKAFIPHPQIVLLDEPTASLDPDIAHQIRKFVKAQQAEFQTTILYTSHNMAEVADVCNRVLVLQHGKIIAEDKPQNLASSVSHVKLVLEIEDGANQVAKLVNSFKISVTTKNKTHVFSLEESQIAPFLTQLASNNITFSQIEINKPTLEDYFLSISNPSAQEAK